MIKRNQLLIGGNWVDASGDGALTVVNPATEEGIAQVARGSANDVDRAVRAAVDAFGGWSQSKLADRAAVLNRIADLMEKRSDEITSTISSEVGEPVRLAARSQTASAIAHLRDTAACVTEVDWDEMVGPTRVHRAAAGVVGAITAWNAPLLMIAWKVGAAVAAGCTVVLKPTEVAPLSSFIFAEATLDAGLPDGVFNLVTGTGPEIGEALVTHPAVDVVSLTGSVRAGRRVMELAAGTIKRVSLELGGKSASIVLADADFEAAVGASVDDGFRNSGQVCAGLTRVLVPRSRLNEAEQIAAERAARFVLGDPLDPATTMGPVTTADQRDRVRGHIDRAIAEGATLVSGGSARPESLPVGYYIKPTVFSATSQHSIARDEVFGPVMTLVPYDTEDDAIRIANDTDYGLAAAIWTRDLDRANALANRVRAGRVRINGSAVNPRAPHGGFKLSGIGRENGRFGIEEFTEFQSIG